MALPFKSSTMSSASIRSVRDGYQGSLLQSTSANVLRFANIYSIATTMKARDFWDETWVHHYEPKSKRQSMEWKHPGSPDHLVTSYNPHGFCSELILKITHFINVINFIILTITKKCSSHFGIFTSIFRTVSCSNEWHIHSISYHIWWLFSHSPFLVYL